MACGRRVLTALHRATRSDDVEVTRRAATCIRDIEARTNPDYLAAEVRLLARLRPSGVVKTMLGTLGHPEVAARKWAYDSLVELAGADDYADVLRAIKDNRPYVRAGAIGLVYKYRDREQRKELAPLLLAAIRDENAVVRRSAAAFLTLAADEEGVVPALIEALKDKDEGPVEGAHVYNWPVASAAVDSLSRLGERARPALPAMMEMAKSGRRRDRRAATNGLGTLARTEKAFVPDVVPLLMQLLEDKNQPINNRSCAAGALGSIGPNAKAAVPALREALKRVDEEPDPEYRERVWGTVICVLGDIGPEAEAAVPDLTAILQDQKQDPFARQRAAEALGKMGPAAKAAIPALTEALNEPPQRREIREAASQALEKIRQ